MPKGNPNPVQTEEFKKMQFKPTSGDYYPLADKQVQIRLPVDVKEALDAMPTNERVEKLRKLISDAVRNGEI